MPEDRGRNSGVISGHDFGHDFCDARFGSGISVSGLCRGIVLAIPQAVESTAPLGAGVHHCTSLRANRGHQLRRCRHIDPIPLSATHDRTANSVQFKLPAGHKVFLHRAAHPGRHAVENRPNLRRVNFRAARIGHGARLRDSRTQFLFPRTICKNLSNIHA